MSAQKQPNNKEDVKYSVMKFVKKTYNTYNPENKYGVWEKKFERLNGCIGYIHPNKMNTIIKSVEAEMTSQQRELEEKQRIAEVEKRTALEMSKALSSTELPDPRQAQTLDDIITTVRRGIKEAEKRELAEQCKQSLFQSSPYFTASDQANEE